MATTSSGIGETTVARDYRAVSLCWVRVVGLSILFLLFGLTGNLMPELKLAYHAGLPHRLENKCVYVYMNY